MKKLFVLSLYMLCSCSLLAQEKVDTVETTSLSEDLRYQNDLEYKLFLINNKNMQNSWINPLYLNSSLTRSSSDGAKSEYRSGSLSYSQSIFNFGKIPNTIQYAKTKTFYDHLRHTQKESQQLLELYVSALDISKMKLALKQIEYQIRNAKITLELKQLQYESGSVDIVELNNAVMDLNSYEKSFSMQHYNLKTKLEAFGLMSQKNIDRVLEEIERIKALHEPMPSVEEFLKHNIDLEKKRQQIEMQHIHYKQSKNGFLPSVALNATISKSSGKDFQYDYEYDSNYYSYGLSVSMPLDFQTSSKLQSSKLELLLQKNQMSIVEKEQRYRYREVYNRYQMYRDEEVIIKKNIALYEKLIVVSGAKSKAGYSSKWDLDILTNRNRINKLDLQINKIHTQIERLRCYMFMDLDDNTRNIK
jgi:outer membrane protein TolC